METNGQLGRDPAKRRATYRARNHQRRFLARIGNVTAEYERKLRARAKRCPLCKVKMTDVPYRPNSKELDHIVPRIMGGTHTVENVRIVCRNCNATRPRNGGDCVDLFTEFADLMTGGDHAETPPIGAESH